MQDVVDALELAGPLQRQDVERLLDDAQPGLVAAGVAADRAERRVADVEAPIAEDDLVADVDQGRREGAGFGVRALEAGGRSAAGPSWGRCPAGGANDSMSRATGSIRGVATGAATAPGS